MRRWDIAFVGLVLAGCSAASLTGPSASAVASASAASAASAASSTTTATVASTVSSCAAPAQAITELTEGPYYKAGAPQRATLSTTGVAGTPLVLTGYVLSTSCQPIANAKLDFWQADGNGNYDNSGYTLRGWQLTDANGAYRLETVIPGLYPGRTEHIHVKVTVNGKTYTSQLFFPGVSQNAGDSIYAANMLIALNSATTTPRTGTFNFIISV